MLQSLSNDVTLEPIAVTQQISGVGLSGLRQKFPLKKGVKNLAVHVSVTGQIQISVANATAVIDTGSILNVIDECGFNDGTDRLPSTPRRQRFWTEAFAGQPVGATRLTSPNIATVQLREDFTVYCSPPTLANRDEVTLMEKSWGSNATFDFYMTHTGVADGGGSRLVTVGGATVLVSNVKVTVVQEYLPAHAPLPLFQPEFVPDNIAVAAANPQMQKYFTRDAYMLAMLFEEQIAGAPLGVRVGDILSTLRLQRTHGKFIGDQFLPKDLYQSLFERSVGGSVYSIGGVNPYTPFYFARKGRLSKIIPPGDQNFLATLNVAPSATAGSSIIGVEYWQLRRDNTVGPQGQRVTATDAQVAAARLTIG